MKLNTRARYAVRLLCDIEMNGDGNPVPLKVTSERQKISRRYLEQLAISLRNAKLLHTVRGMHGGYKLARPAGEITILSIVEAVDGPVLILDCLSGKSDCHHFATCESRPVWKKVNDGIVSTLSATTLGDLAAANRKKLSRNKKPQKKNKK